MPVICMFFGIVIYMQYDDHNPPHFHAEYQGERASFDFDGNQLNGSFPKKQTKLVQAWCEIHREELMADWELASEKTEIFRIDPLR